MNTMARSGRACNSPPVLAVGLTRGPQAHQSLEKEKGHAIGWEWPFLLRRAEQNAGFSDITGRVKLAVIARLLQV
jgi:hypothetical protein